MRPRRRGTAAALVIALAALLAAACSDDDGDGGPLPEPRCGDGVCSGATCETPVRCFRDCGTCSGAGCAVPADGQGDCGKPCASSCACRHPGEVCSADLDGSAQGVCVPLDCIQCSSGQRCDYTVVAEGRCSAGTCI